jgi:hypothetical protein
LAAKAASVSVELEELVMSAKKQKEGEGMDAVEQDAGAADAAGTPVGEHADKPPTEKSDSGAKPPEAAARKPDTPKTEIPKGDVKAGGEVKSTAKSKAKDQPAAGKPAEAKSLAEVMKFDLKIRRRPRF